MKILKLNDHVYNLDLVCSINLSDNNLIFTMIHGVKDCHQFNNNSLSEEAFNYILEFLINEDSKYLTLTVK